MKNNFFYTFSSVKIKKIIFFSGDLVKKKIIIFQDLFVPFLDYITDSSVSIIITTTQYGQIKFLFFGSNFAGKMHNLNSNPLKNYIFINSRIIGVLKTKQNQIVA